MGNSFIQMQCRNMKIQTEIFMQACKMAALKDDGKVSREETKTLKAIEAATLKFSKELSKIIDNT